MSRTWYMRPDGNRSGACASVSRGFDLGFSTAEVLKRALRHYGNCVKEKRKVKAPCKLLASCFERHMPFW